MSPRAASPSARESELLDLVYDYVLAHGLSDLSLRPLASAVGSSPRVLLFLFGSKDELVRRLLERARSDELAWLREQPAGAVEGLAETVRSVWAWLSDPSHDQVLRLWAEAYARSLRERDGPWAGFARGTVDDWLRLLAASQPTPERRTALGRDRRTQALALLRGSLLDLLATGDRRRVDAAVARAASGLG